MVVSPELSAEADVSDLPLPLPDDLFVPLHDSEEIVLDLLKRLPTMFSHSKDVETAFGPALSGAIKLVSGFGAKIMCFLSSLPSWGVGRLRNRDDRRAYGTAQEKDLVQPGSEWYKEIAVKCSADQISIDLYLAGLTYIDVATLNQLAKYTGGQVVYLKNFQSHYKTGAKRSTPEELRLKNHVMRSVCRETGFEAVMRIRCSAGFKITQFIGHFNIRGQDLMGLPNADEDKAVAVLIAHNTQSGQTPIAPFCIQAALLYTTSSGERRIRVHTLCLPLATAALQLYRSLDSPTLWNILTKMAVDKMLSSGFEAGRALVVDSLVALLKTFLSLLGHEQRTTSHLLLPDPLALLPAAINAIVKSPCLRSDLETSPDDRSAHLVQVMTVGTAGTLAFFHPRLYDVVQTMAQRQPAMVSAVSSTSLDAGGVFLLDCGHWLSVWVGKRVPKEVLLELFGAERPEDVVAFAPLSQNNGPVLQLVETLQNTPNGLGSPPIIFVRQGSALERTYVHQHLVEDEFGGTMSYTNFLCFLQRRVQAVSTS
jgi:protein transport protein SEC24